MSSAPSQQQDKSYNNLTVHGTLVVQDRLVAKNVSLGNVLASDIVAGVISAQAVGTSGPLMTQGTITAMSGNIEAVNGNVTAAGNVVAGNNVQATVGNVEIQGPASGLLFPNLQTLTSVPTTTAQFAVRAGSVVFSTPALGATSTAVFTITNSLVTALTKGIFSISGGTLATVGLSVGEIVYAAGTIGIRLTNLGSVALTTPITVNFLLLN